MKPTDSKIPHEIYTGNEDVDIMDLREKFESITNTILKNEQKLDSSDWKDVICAVVGLSQINHYKFYPAIEGIIMNHVKVTEQNLAQEKLLENYCVAWRKYIESRKHLRTLFSNGMRYHDIERITKSAWKNNMLKQRGREITSLLWNVIKKGENGVAVAQEVVQSFVHVDANDCFEKLFFEKLSEHYKSKTSEWFQGLNVLSEFIEKVLQKVEEEVEWGLKFLPGRSIGIMKSILVENVTEQRMNEMMKECQLMSNENRQDELKKLYKILKMLPAERFWQGRLTATLRITVRNEALDSSCLNMEEFEANLLNIYRKYKALLGELFSNDCVCICMLQKFLKYDTVKDRCDGTTMLEECIKEVCSSKYSVSESDLKASELKALLPKLKLIFEKLNVLSTKPNLKHMILHEDEEFEQKKPRLSDSRG